MGSRFHRASLGANRRLRTLPSVCEGRCIHIYEADHIVFTGDSLTNGVVNAPWMDDLQDFCTAKYTAAARTPPTFANTAVAGTGSVWFKDHIDEMINDEEPDLAWIFTGINDIDNGSVPTLTHYRNNMNEGIDLIDPGVSLAFNSPWERIDDDYASDIMAMRDVVSEIATERGAGFVDFRYRWDIASNAERVGRLFDHVHPTEPSGNNWLSSIALQQVIFHMSPRP